MRKKRKSVAIAVSAILTTSLFAGCTGIKDYSQRFLMGAKDKIDVEVIEKCMSAVSDFVKNSEYQEKNEEEKREAVEGYLKTLISDGLVKKDSVYVDEEKGIVSYEYAGGGSAAVAVKELESDPEDKEYIETVYQTVEQVGKEYVEEKMMESSHEVAAVSKVTKPAVEDVIVKTEVKKEEEKVVEGTTPSEPQKGEVVHVTGSEKEMEEKIEEIEDSDEDLSEETSYEVLKGASILVLDAFEDERDNIYNVVEGVFNDLGLITNVDKTVTLEDYLTVKDYNFVMFSMHGTEMVNRKTGYLEPVMCLLDDEITVEKLNSDLYYNAIARGEAATITYVDGTESFAIFPEFFYYEFKDNAFANTVFISESCMFYGQCINSYCDFEEDEFCDNVAPDFGNALNNKGALAVSGFHNSVSAIYAINYAVSFTEIMVRGYSPEVAYATCLYEYGFTDYAYIPRSNPAYALLMGNRTGCTIKDMDVDLEVEEREDIPAITEEEQEAIEEVKSISEAGVEYYFNADTKNYGYVIGLNDLSNPNFEDEYYLYISDPDEIEYYGDHDGISNSRWNLYEPSGEELDALYNDWFDLSEQELVENVYNYFGEKIIGKTISISTEYGNEVKFEVADIIYDSIVVDYYYSDYDNAVVDIIYNIELQAR